MFRFRCLVLVSVSLAFVVAACPPAANYDPTYENVAATIVASCGSESNTCHGGAGRGNARLHFGNALANGDFRTALVNVEACEYDLLDRVTPGDPDNSWLMFKLNHEFAADGTLLFTPDSNWDHGLTERTDGTFPPSTCPLTTDEGALSFGTTMPQDLAGPRPLAEAQIEMIRLWIAGGALGPGETVETGSTDGGS